MKKYFYISFLVLIFCFLGFASKTTYAAVTFNNTNTPVDTGTTPLSKPLSVTAGGTNTAAFACVTYDEAAGMSISSISYGGHAMTSAGTVASSGNLYAEVYYLVNPPTGSNTLLVSVSGTVSDIYANLISFNGVNQTTPIRSGTYVATTTGGAGVWNVPISSNVNDLTMTCADTGTNDGVDTTNQTVDGVDNNGVSQLESDHATTPSSTVTHSWTTFGGTGEALVGFSIQFQPTTSPTNASGYAWGNKMGWVNFGTQTGGLEVDTTTVSGYAWSQNFGWINLSASGPPAITYVGGAANYCGGGASSCTVNYSPAAGDLVVVQVDSNDGGDISTTTDNAAGGSTAYNVELNGDGTPFDDSCGTANGGWGCALYYSCSVKSGVSQITANFSPDDVGGLLVQEFSGIATSSCADASSTEAEGTSNNQTSTAINTTNANDVLIGFVFHGNEELDTFSGNNGWLATSLVEPQSSEVHAAMYKIVSATGTYEAQSNTGATSTDWGSYIASFKGSDIPAFGVQNDGEGNLSGYAWAQDAGYINFNGVTIDHSGVFHGVASGTVAGSLQFDNSGGCTYCNVSTTWTPSGVPLTVSAVNLSTVSGGINPATLTLTAATTTDISVDATVTDATCGDIAAGTTTVLLYRSGVSSSSCMSGSGNGVSSNLNCYVATAFTASSTCAGGTINTTTTFPVEYFAQATDASSSFPNQNWIGTVIFNDLTNPTSSADSTYATSSNVMATLTAVAANVGGAGTTSIVQVAPTSTTPNVVQGSSVSQSFGVLPQAGDLIAVVITENLNLPVLGIASVTDNQGNGNYVLAANATTTDDSGEASVYYAKNIGTPSGTFTVTVTMNSSTYEDVGIYDIRGADPSNPVPVGNTTSTVGTGTNVLTGQLSPGTNAVYVGVLTGDNQDFSTITPTSTWTERWRYLSSSPAAMDTIDLTTSTSHAAQWTIDGESYAAALVAFDAASIGGPSLNYGTLAPSSTTGSADRMVAVMNVGNSSSSLKLSGTALANGGNSIATSSQHYATSSFTFGGAEQLLSGTPASVSGFLLTAPTSTSNVQSTVYWGLQVPNNTASGTYNGINTFTAVFSS